MLGSSAGGFMSVIIGQILNAESIYSFNGQFEILSLLKNPNAEISDPIVYRNKNNAELLPYCDSVRFIKNPSSIFYFHSVKSRKDITQLKHIVSVPINIIKFKTSNHGIPFLKSNLPIVLNYSIDDLKKYAGKKIHPLY